MFLLIHFTFQYQLLSLQCPSQSYPIPPSLLLWERDRSRENMWALKSVYQFHSSENWTLEQMEGRFNADASFKPFMVLKTVSDPTADEMCLCFRHWFLSFTGLVNWAWCTTAVLLVVFLYELRAVYFWDSYCTYFQKHTFLSLYLNCRKN